jgi:hypothetical protein
MKLTVLFLRSFDLQPSCAPTARTMIYPAISILFSVWVTLTNHYWVSSDERRRIIGHDSIPHSVEAVW